MKEKCIMPESYLYSTIRREGLERHEIFFGKNRKRSIEDGLVVFLTAEQHRGTNGVHGKNGSELNKTLKLLGQKTAMDYYGWTVEDFRGRYGKSYL